MEIPLSQQGAGGKDVANERKACESVVAGRPQLFYTVQSRLSIDEFVSSQPGHRVQGHGDASPTENEN
ncbi:hypothetical protein L345_17450, partial [Ophiophagus hannah]